MQTTQPKISVIIPTYNRKHYLAKAINSVFNQTYTDYELIVVDDASTDGTTGFLATEYPQIHCLSLPNNRGAGGARNEGIKIAKGEFIAFLDSDDEWLPKYLETQLQYIESSPDHVIAFCGCFHQFLNGKVEKFSCQPWLPYPNLTYHLLAENFILTTSIVMVRSQDLKEVGYFNEQLKIGEDKELFLRLLSWGKGVHVPKILVTKHSHSSNLTRDNQQWIKGTFQLLDVFFAHDLSQPYKHFETEARSHNALRLARIFWNEKKQYLLALQMLVKAVAISPSYITSYVWKKLIKAV
ncbi:MAG TPA: glycosyltransferase family A protein [Nostocaceae cyanobacterium]|nr:glycosyltransferase family A protein [Nostocaceae cyanobacterium]